jgi:undecaprenyl-diphosphatase
VTLAHPRGVLILSLAVFVAVTLFVAIVRTVPGDVVVRDAVLDAASPPVVAVMRVVNMAGDWRILFPGTLLLLLAFDRARRLWWLWIALMIVAAGWPDVMKAVVGRPRPEKLSWGFPSGHATAAAAYFGAIVYLAGALRPAGRRLVRAGAFLMIVLVGLARVVLRAHWPSDVLGGIALGLAFAAAAALIDGLSPASDQANSSSMNTVPGTGLKR